MYIMFLYTFCMTSLICVLLYAQKDNKISCILTGRMPGFKIGRGEGEGVFPNTPLIGSDIGPCFSVEGEDGGRAL